MNLHDTHTLQISGRGENGTNWRMLATWWLPAQNQGINLMAHEP